MVDNIEQITSLPGRILLDTCILNQIYEQSEYIFEGVLPEKGDESDVGVDLKALRSILLVNQRASFQFLISPISIAEIVNIQDFEYREMLLHWVLDMLNHWLIMLDDIKDRSVNGGSVRHRFKFSSELQSLESTLMEIQDFRRDPFDRLLLLQYKMGNCDAFLTVDNKTILKHRSKLFRLGFHILRPKEFWELLRPWASIWY